MHRMKLQRVSFSSDTIDPICRANCSPIDSKERWPPRGVAPPPRGDAPPTSVSEARGDEKALARSKTDARRGVLSPPLSPPSCSFGTL
eukprot:6405230-Prymnesium_polylepis.1